jgi:type I restriction enzyme, R subunit
MRTELTLLTPINKVKEVNRVPNPMNEAETRAELIDPALKAAGWGVVEGSRSRREYVISPGRLEGKGKRGKVLKADYILEYRNTKLAVVEAKAASEAITEGVGQAKDYAGKLAIRFTYATNGKVPKNGSVFFAIFQTFLASAGSGAGDDVEQVIIPPDLPVKYDKPGKVKKAEGYFGEYPPDFFDFIIIDECHRGGANDESTWRDILNYFSPAVQLGLTATPKRRDNVDTYLYFGEPVFTYSLKDGINDGFLTPFRVRQISTTLDEYTWTPDDTIMEGEVEQGRLYGESDFNKKIEIKERERKRVELFMAQIDQTQKTLVFCANQAHALLVRDLINQTKTSKDPNYCQRVTADDGELGEQHLRDFQDNEKSIPTILTTSQKLSTGVDARNIRNIVLMRPVNSMIEFKQIIGRGTRLFDGKDYFTIYDFVRAHEDFHDEEWDGPPAEPPTAPSPSGQSSPPPPRQRAKVKLADGKERSIQHMMMTTFWHPDGTPMSAQQFIELLYGKLPEFFHDEAELRTLWSQPDTRKKLLEGLAEKGFGKDQLAEMQQVIDASHSDLFDVLAYVAYCLPPLTREQRAAKAKVEISTHFSSKQQVFLDFVLSHYTCSGVGELDQEKLSPLLKLKYHNSIADAVADLGDDVARVFSGFQKHLYTEHVA